jgi:hypothetical protein
LDAQPPAGDEPGANGAEGLGDENGAADGAARPRELTEAERERLRAAGFDPRAVDPIALEDAGLLLDFLLGAGP